MYDSSVISEAFLARAGDYAIMSPASIDSASFARKWQVPTMFVVGCSCLLLANAAAPERSTEKPASDGLTVFENYTPLSANTEMARRLLRPLTTATLSSRLATLHKQLSDQAIDLTHERFRVRLPATRPPGGYGVIVFIPPWQDSHLPDGWGRSLDKLGMIFVSAERSGNDESPLGRRIPLAILAAYNVMEHYPVDPARVIVSGFSGGSRVALRVAVGYPDLFRAAILDAGSDPIGGEDRPLPPRDLFETFRLHSRVIYVTGSQDELHLDQASTSIGSLKRWCMPNFAQRTISGLGHETMPGSALADAVSNLMTASGDERIERDASCWQKLNSTIDARLAAVESETRSGQTSEAAHHLKEIDSTFSGLASPRVLDLARQLGMIGDTRPAD